MGRLGTADEIANAVLFLAGDGSNYITAQTLHINGGYRHNKSKYQLTLNTIFALAFDINHLLIKVKP
jgi:hypothetical protein